MDQHRGNRGDDGSHQESHERVVAVAVATISHAPENRGPLGHVCKEHDGSRQCGGDRTDENVPVFHVTQLMGQYAFHLLVVQQFQDALGDSHRRMVRVPAGGEGVRGSLGHHVEARHGKRGPGTESLDDRVQPRGLFP